MSMAIAHKKQNAQLEDRNYLVYLGFSITAIFDKN